MGKNLFQKVFEKHRLKTLSSGKSQVVIGLHMIHEVTSPQAFAMLRERNVEVLHPERTFAVVDHIIPTEDRSRPLADPKAEEMFQALESNAKKSGIRFFDPKKSEEGIVHVVGPEMGLTQPGMTIACGDSHTSTHGAFGALAFGIGTSQIRDVLGTQTLALDPLKVRKIEICGNLQAGVYPKDVILQIIRILGVQGGVGYAYEFCGEAIERMNMEGRMTICNMAIEGGARIGYINPDQTTYDYLKGRKYAPQDSAWEQALTYWEGIKSDADADYDDVVLIEADKIEPVVTWGITPAQSVFVSEALPAKSDFKKEDSALASEAFDYMGVTPGQSTTELKVDVCFIGSCTNGRISDFQEVARHLKGKKVSPDVQALAVPGSREVAKKAEALGLDKIFKEAGFEWREPGCSMCLAMNPDRLKGNQRSASSSNRNFKGRQGSSSGRTHLMSPLMVAAAAIEGHIADARKVFSL